MKGHTKRRFLPLVTRCKENSLRFELVLLAIALLGIASFARQAPAQRTEASASIEGRVTDGQNRPLPGVKVQVSSTSGNGVWSTQSGPDGKYAISGLAQGTYSIHADGNSNSFTDVAAVTVAAEKSKQIDLVLRPEAAPKGQSSLGTPEFFDQPQFTIAGVTDTTNLGGHASGMAGPSESVAHDAVSLSKPSRPSSQVGRERTARAAADRAPDDADANYAAGDLLLINGKPREAISYLQRALERKRDDFAIASRLAEAYADAGENTEARTLIETLLKRRDDAHLHHLRADIDERTGNALEAVNEYAVAAKLDPSETNLFDWGAELLKHHAIEPAVAVFKDGVRRFPNSARMLAVLGAASYERGSYDEALRYISAASDLNPQDPAPYLLLGKMQRAGFGPSDATLAKLERFVRLQPQNPLANYYYALALWNHRQGASDAATSQVESLLTRAVSLDPKLAEAFFQLGVLYAERNETSRAIAAYQKAVEIDSDFVQAHYRLAQVYMADGQKQAAHEEIERYKQASKSKAGRLEQERKEVQQFIYTMNNTSSNRPQP